MSLKKGTSPSPPPVSSPTERMQSPSPLGLRHRPSPRTTFSNRDGDLPRRGSFFSDSFSDTHRSFRASTDDLLLPRVKTTTSTFDDQVETSHWHSVPLGLALLPAVGGLFFKDGSAVITDITLLGLAAIFLNWALRLPWEWYKTAQATVTFDFQPQSAIPPFLEEDEDRIIEDDGSTAADAHQTPNKVHAQPHGENSDDEEIAAAQQELRLHELLALLACFVFPLLGAWLLHAIRSQLSRPSEGLVSNYNLTIFLLVAEIRPLSHLIKLVQRRTLYLQRRVNTKVIQQEQHEEKQDMSEMVRRLEEIEAHVASASVASLSDKNKSDIPPERLAAQAASQASAELRKAFQPELDALNRAMRRYEKRMTITAIQVESRLQDLETRLKDVVSLAAAAQRSAEKRPRGYISTLANWLGAIVVVPVQYMHRAMKLPGKLVHGLLNWLKVVLRLDRGPDLKDGKAPSRSATSRARGTQKKSKSVA